MDETAHTGGTEEASARAAGGAGAAGGGLRWRHRVHRFVLTELRLLVALLAIVGAVWSFLLLADEVGEGSTQRFDEAVVGALRDPADPALVRGSIALTEIARDVTALGSIGVLSLVTLAVVGFLALSRLWRSAALVIAAALGGTAWTFLLKDFFARERPRLTVDQVVSATSFPSGHSALSAVVFLTLAALLARLVERRALRVYVVGIAALVVALVGASRVALGVHYPSDVLAGWTLGLAWALCCWTAMTLLQRRGKVETVAEAHGHPEDDRAAGGAGVTPGPDARSF